MITVLAVGGTGESYPGDERTVVSGMLAGVTSELDSRFRARWVPYPASYGPSPRLDGPSYESSLAAGVSALRAAVEDSVPDDSVDPVMLIGYSQGAVVIRRLLTDPESAPLLPRIAAVGLVADPHQPPGAVRGCTGWGVAGPGPELPAAVPVFWIGAPEDLICNASPDSLIRDIADLSGSLSAGRVRWWLADIWDRIRDGRLQNAARTRIAPSQWRRDVRRLVVAAREVRGYLPSGGRHVSYGAEPYRRAPLTAPEVTGCQVLAHRLQVQATLGEQRRAA